MRGPVAGGSGARSFGIALRGWRECVSPLETGLAAGLDTGMFRSVGGRRPESIAAWPVRSQLGDRAEEEALVADLRVTAAAYPAAGAWPR
ncbi:hypothetical protein ACFXJ5_20445 [Streptomyces sp. NPDC059373]